MDGLKNFDANYNGDPNSANMNNNQQQNKKSRSDCIF